MRRLLTFAAFLVIVSVMPVCAQRGGGHGSSGGHGGFSGARGGISGHSGFASHSVAAPGLSGSRVSSSRVVSGARPNVSGDHLRGRTFERTFTHRYYGYGYPYRYGYPYYSYYDPYWDYWWWDSHSSYDEDAARDRELADEMNADNLREQQMLREQDQDMYAPRAAAPARTEEHAQNEPPTVLVFRDSHQREIQNYAIVGSMLWSFSPQRTEKIPLADLDVPATIKANEDRGIEFHVPGSSGEQRIEKLWLQPGPPS